MLSHLGPCWLWIDWPSWVSSFLELVINLSRKGACQMQINHYKACTPNHLQGHYPLALITAGPNTRHVGTAPMYYSLMKIFKLANPRPALLVPSHGIHSRSPCRHLPPDWPWYVPEWLAPYMACHASCFYGSLTTTKLPSLWQLFSYTCFTIPD